jgi:integrase
MLGSVKKSVKFERVEFGLFRYKPSGVFYTVLKKDGKTKWRNLKINDKATAWRLLAGTGRELDSELFGLESEELTKSYLATIANKAKKTLKARRGVTKQLLAAIPPTTKVHDVKPSDLASWAASLKVGEETHNEYIRVIKNNMFDLTVADKAILKSPDSELKWRKVPDHRKPTPTFEEFKTIVASIRTQKFNAHAQDSADFVEFIGLAGLGQTELRSLRLGDVRWDKNRLDVRRQKTGKVFQMSIYPQIKPLLEKLCVQASQPEPTTDDEHQRLSERRLFSIDDAKKQWKPPASSLVI